MNFNAYGRSKGFSLPEVRITGGPQTQVENAAGLVNLANAFASNRKSAPRFDEIAATNYAQRSAERALNTEIKGGIEAQKIANEYGIKAAEIQADAAKSAAKSEAQGSMIGSTIGAIGTIAGTALMFSDESTKDNIEKIEDALTKLRNLRPVTFNYKEEFSMTPERMHHGFIAQEYEKVMPDATYYDGEYEKLCIDTVDLIALLVRGIQQLETRVARMEAANALAGVK